VGSKQRSAGFGTPAFSGPDWSILTD